jgi:hypothetical protein
MAILQPKISDNVIHKLKGWTGRVIAIDAKNERFTVRWKGRQTLSYSFRNQLVMNVSAIKRENNK